jgi:lipopolysaccharide export system protein LptC
MNSLSTISTLHTVEKRGFATTGRRDTELMFHRAMRHSRRVRTLRVAIPVIIALMLGSIWFMSWLDPLRILVRLPTDSGKLVISGTKLTMQAPKLNGYTRDGRWYELTADSAAQDITKPNLVELHDVRAKIEAEDKSLMNVSAADGIFDRKSGVLTLGRDILLNSTNGYAVHLIEAVIDTGSGDIVSNKPVEVQMLQGTLNAKRVQVTKAGNLIQFGGGVVMDLAAGALESAKPENDRR